MRTMNQDIFAQALNFQNDSSPQPDVDYNEALQLAALGLNPAMAKGAKLKKQKQNNAKNHRAGDWVCILCNNLNYSFRNTCNRCQMQTKKNNLIQALGLLNDPNAQLNNPQIQNVQYPNPMNAQPQARKPFTDITNQHNNAAHVYALNNIGGSQSQNGRKHQNSQQQNCKGNQPAHFSLFDTNSNFGDIQNSISNFGENQNASKSNMNSMSWMQSLQYYPEESTNANLKGNQNPNWEAPQVSEFTPDTQNAYPQSATSFLDVHSYDEQLPSQALKTQSQLDANGESHLTSNASTTTTRSNEEESKSSYKMFSKQSQGFNLALFLNECLITPKKVKNESKPYKSPDQLPPVSHLLQRIQDSDSKGVHASSSKVCRRLNSASGDFKGQRKISEGEPLGENLDLEDDEFNVIIDLSRKLTMEVSEKVEDDQSQKSI